MVKTQVSYQLCGCTFGSESLEGDSECGDHSKLFLRKTIVKKEGWGRGTKGTEGQQTCITWVETAVQEAG